MDEAHKSLSKHRYEQALTTLSSANLLIQHGDYEGAANRTYKEAKANGKKEGAQESRLNDIRALMNNCHWTAKQAMDALSISLEEQKKL